MPRRTRSWALRRGDVFAAQADAARVGLERSGQLADQRRLAGAVRADDGMDFARVDVEVERIGGDQSAEALGQAAHLEQRHAGRRLDSTPASPRGAKNTIASRISPSGRCQ